MNKCIVREEMVLAEAVETDPIACPRCSGKDLTLYGNLQRAYIVTLVNGKTTEEQYEPEEPLTHEVEIIECNNCKTRFLIQSKEQWELQTDFLMLQKELTKVTGIGKPS